jgi:hypothetical protein
MAKDGPFASA